MHRLYSDFNLLKLDTLPVSWVDEVTCSHYQVSSCLPPEYIYAKNPDKILTILDDILNSCGQWYEDNNIEDEKSWVTLSLKVDRRSLLCLLACCIKIGCTNIVKEVCRNCAFTAARLYYRLVIVSGYNAFCIYNDQLFTDSLGCLDFVRALYQEGARSTVLRYTASQLELYASDLQKALIQLCLLPDGSCFYDILVALIGVNHAVVAFKIIDESTTLTKAIDIIHNTINICLQDDRCDPEKLFLIFFEVVFYKIHLLDNRCGNNFVRHLYVKQVEVLAEVHGCVVLETLIVLLQHLCYSNDGLERSENRLLLVQLVVSFMDILQSYHAQFTNWLILLLRTTKVSHRQIAMEILFRVLNQNDTESVDNEDPMPMEVPPVPTSSIYDNPTPSTSADYHEPPTVEDVDMPEAEPSETIPRPGKVAHGAILRAIYSRLLDHSSSIRSRAICMISECMQSPNNSIKAALREMNISNIGDLAVQFLADERALVRKSAVRLLYRIAKDYPEQFNNQHCRSFVMSSRDSSISVRSTAISLIGQLGNTDLGLGVFIDGPFRQIADTEIRVQEQVVKQVEELLVIPLKRHGKMKSDSPWRFMKYLIDHDLRSQLHIVFQILNVRSGEGFGHKLILTVKSHLQSRKTDNLKHLYCLVMLLAASKYLGDISADFLVDYYYRLAADPEDRDIRLVSFTFELLRLWSNSISPHLKRDLRQHVISRLEDGTWMVEGCYLRSSELAAHLDTTNLLWADQLMTRYETIVKSGSTVEVMLCAANLSHVANSEPSSNLVDLLLSILSPEYVNNWDGCMVAALGRICIRSRIASQYSCPVLATVLCTENGTLSARVNAIHALTDICTRYPGLITEFELYNMYGCLKKSNPAELRRTASKAFTELLLGEFMRNKKPHINRYYLLIGDSDSEVREPAEFYVSTTLSEDYICKNFVFCIKEFNGYNVPPNAPSLDDITSEDRYAVYNVMLQRLTLVRKYNIQCGLAQDIFGHAAELCHERGGGNEVLPDSLKSAVQDAIHIICGPHFKISNKPEGDPADPDTLTDCVSSSIVSVNTKKMVAEALLPNVMRLYNCTRNLEGPFLNALVKLGSELYKEYKQETESIIFADENFKRCIREFQRSIGGDNSPATRRNLLPPPPETPRRSGRPKTYRGRSSTSRNHRNS